MGPVKRVLLGSAAGVFAVAGAQAADLAVKAKPVEYVKVCSLYGAGFWYVPGTDTCIKIGAFVRADVNWNAGGNGNPIGFGGATADPSGLNTRTQTGNLAFRNRNALSFDMRTQTEYGTLRSYLDVGTQTLVSNNTGGANNFSNNGTSSSIYASRAFIQFAGFTAGRIRSFFDMFNLGNYSLTQGQTTGDTSANGLFGLAYTWQFGGGLSASLSAEDGGFGINGRSRQTVNLDVPASLPLGATVLVDNKGNQTLDPVLNVRLDQAWGFAGVSAALHDASGGYYGTTQTGLTTAGHPGDKFGWAVAGSFLLTNVLGLQGDTLGAMAVFSRGAQSYAEGGWATKSVFGSGNQFGVGWITDGVYAAGHDVQLTDVWSITGAYEHVWTRQWKTSAYGGFVGVNYNDEAKGIICANPTAPKGTTLTNVTNCSPDFSYSVAGTRTQWNPVPDLDVSLDLAWYHLNTAFGGTATIPTTGARPAGSYAVNDQDVFAAYFRLQRNFLY
jgi:hypothetical protein